MTDAFVIWTKKIWKKQKELKEIFYKQIFMYIVRDIDLEKKKKQWHTFILISTSFKLFSSCFRLFLIESIHIITFTTIWMNESKKKRTTTTTTFIYNLTKKEWNEKQTIDLAIFFRIIRNFCVKLNNSLLWTLNVSFSAYFSFYYFSLFSISYSFAINN